MSTDTLTYSTTAARRWPQWVQLGAGHAAPRRRRFRGSDEQSIAAYGKAHHLTLPNIEYVLWAIIFGTHRRQHGGIPPILSRGRRTYEFGSKRASCCWRPVSLGDIVLLGASASRRGHRAGGRDCADDGARPRVRPVAEAREPAVDRIVGVRRLRDQSRPKGAIDADDEDASYAMAAILALGAVSLFVSR